jgi:large subunit ribosomal protein L17
MKHRVAGRKLGRTSEHRLALLRNLATSLLDKEKVRTTLPKAKELRPFVERLITLSKRETLHARRRVLRHVRSRTVVAKLFDTLAARYATRPGGYTRVLHLGPRRGDHAEMALIELVGAEPARRVEHAPKKGKASKAAPPRAEAPGGGEAAAAEEQKPGRRGGKRAGAAGKADAGSKAKPGAKRGPAKGGAPKKGPRKIGGGS